MKPYYQDEYATIYHGSMESAEGIGAELVLTDIPYSEVNQEDSGLRNLDKEKADVATIQLPNLMEVIARNCKGSAYIFCGIGQISPIRDFLKERKFSTRLCIWEKTNPSPMNGQFLWLNSIEACVFGKMASATFNENCKSSVFRGKLAESNGHPTPKPEWLFSRMILASTNAGDLVFDPFAGSGTSLVCAKNHGRKAIGFELDESYCEIAARRLSQEVLPLA